MPSDDHSILVSAAAAETHGDVRVECFEGESIVLEMSCSEVQWSFLFDK